jgi:hypothetical protein
MSEHTRNSPRGFRLVDLLTVAGITALVLPLLVSWLSRVRDSDYNLQCQNNLGVLARALHGYAMVHGNALPALSGAPIEGGAARPQSIFFTLMPHVEEQEIYEAGMKQAGGRTWEAVDPQGGRRLLETPLWLLRCPMDSSNSTALQGDPWWGWSSYAANAQLFGIVHHVVKDAEPGRTSWNVLTPVYTITTIPDGSSNTIGMTERFALAGRGNNTTPCLWAYPPGGASAAGDLDLLGSPLQSFVGASGAFKASLCGPATFFGSGTQADPVGAIVGDGSVPMYPLPEIHVDPENGSTDGRAQTRHRYALVAMADGAVRSVNPDVSQLTWVRAICPDDRQGIASDW